MLGDWETVESNPEKLGLEIVYRAEEPDLSYEFNTVLVFPDAAYLLKATGI